MGMQWRGSSDLLIDIAEPWLFAQKGLAFRSKRSIGVLQAGRTARAKDPAPCRSLRSRARLSATPGMAVQHTEKGLPMSIKLTDVQLTMLSAAAQREDRCLVAPKHLRGIPAQKAAAKLIEPGLAKEILAKGAMPVWRHDEEAGRSYSLKLTSAGMKLASGESSVAQPTEGKEATLVVSELAVASDPGRHDCERSCNGANGCRFRQSFQNGAARRHEDRAGDRTAAAR